MDSNSQPSAPIEAQGTLRPAPGSTLLGLVVLSVLLLLCNFALAVWTILRLDELNRRETKQNGGATQAVSELIAQLQKKSNLDPGVPNPKGEKVALKYASVAVLPFKIKEEDFWPKAVEVEAARAT